MKELDAEFSEYPFRFDLHHLTVVADRPERPVPMYKTGGGANHLAYHLGVLLALHHFTSNNRKPMPAFLFLDQPTQVCARISVVRASQVILRVHGFWSTVRSCYADSAGHHLSQGL